MLANILGPLKTTVRQLIILTWKSSSLGPTDERAHCFLYQLIRALTCAYFQAHIHWGCQMAAFPTQLWHS